MNPKPFKAIVFVSSPYTLGDKQANVDTQRRVAHQLLDLGYCPIVPLLSHYLEEMRPRPWEEWMHMDFALLAMAHCLLRLPGQSKGADMEVAHATALGIPVYYSLPQLLEDAFEPVIDDDPKHRPALRANEALGIAVLWVAMFVFWLMGTI